jgi:hypothetical protein
MAGLVLNSTAVFQLNFCAKLNICASISATFAKPETVNSTMLSYVPPFFQFTFLVKINSH